MSIFSKKLKLDILYGLASFSLIGLIGILVNVLIAYHYNAEVLGVFNQAYAVFLLLSQLCVWGLHLSILRFLPEKNNEESSDLIFSSAFYLVLLSSFVFCLIVYFSSPIFSIVFNSFNVEKSIVYGLPGIFLLALNKVYLAFHNAKRRMRAFAFLNSLRYILMFLFLLLLIYFEVNGFKISLIITFSELSLFIILMLYSSQYVRFSFSYDQLLPWFQKHTSFGLKAALGNILLDVNTRVDVVMLGIFMSDKTVGIYSFAAMLAEGFYQISVVFRTNVNPILTKLNFDYGRKSLRQAIQKGRNLAYLFSIPIGITLIVIYPFFISFLDPSYQNSINVLSFTVLILGFLSVSGYIPFQMLLSQTGYPGPQTKISSGIFIWNLFFNLILIPFWGPIGAAIANCTATIFGVFLLKKEVNKLMKIQI